MATRQADIAAPDVWQNRIVGLLLGVTAVILPVILMPTGWDERSWLSASGF